MSFSIEFADDTQQYQACIKVVGVGGSGGNAIDTMIHFGLEGVEFSSIRFTPKSYPEACPNPRFKDQLCQGIFVTVTDRERLDALAVGLHIVNAVRTFYPEHFRWRESHFDRLLGSKAVRESLIAGKSVATILAEDAKLREAFERTRRNYLRY